MGIVETALGLTGAAIVAAGFVAGLVICLKWVGEKAIDLLLDLVG